MNTKQVIDRCIDIIIGEMNEGYKTVNLTNILVMLREIEKTIK